MTDQFDDLPQIPYNPTAEQSVIGAIIINPGILKGLRIGADEFYLDKHKFIFNAFQEMARRGMNIDFLTVTAELERGGKLAEIGGSAYLMEVVSKTPTSMHAETYARIVKEKAIRRRVIAVAQDLVKHAYGLGAIDGPVSQALDALSRVTTGQKQAQHIGQYLSAIYDEVDAAHNNPTEVPGIPTGFRDWDKKTGGLQKGEVVKLSGPPGLGKSLLAVDVLRNAAKAGHPCALFELEMSGKTVTRRLVSSQAKIPTRAMQTGSMSDDQWPAFTAAIESLSALQIHILDVSILTTAELRAELHRLQDQFGVELAVVDYEYLLADDDFRGDAIERSKLISKRVHAIFKDLDIAGLVIDDMNKAGINGEGGKTGLSGSAGKIYDADQIIIMKPSPKNENSVFLQWEKLREGANPNIFVELVKLQGLPAFGDVRMP